MAYGGNAPVLGTQGLMNQKPIGQRLNSSFAWRVSRRELLGTIFKRQPVR
jgi:hypothetical protein